MDDVDDDDCVWGEGAVILGVFITFLKAGYGQDTLQTNQS